MNRQQVLSGILIGGTVILSSPKIVWAAPTQITAVKVSPTKNGIDIVLEVSPNSSVQGTNPVDRPQVFTLSQDKSWIADITNAQLSLSGQTQEFHQDNPIPGIASISVVPSSANSVRVSVTGQTISPAGQVTQQGSDKIVLSLIRSLPNSATVKPVNQTLESGTDKPIFTPPSESTSQPVSSPQPNLPPKNSNQPSSRTSVAETKPSIPTVVPPVLKEAPNPTSNPDKLNYVDVDVSPPIVKLNTDTRIDRLVLKETPVREVLALLARAVDLGIVYSEDLPPSSPGTTQTPAGTSQAGGTVLDSTISLDMENELVQDAFNYILQAKGLRANLVGKTIFVGQNLPVTTGNYIARTLRLNQMQATLPQVNVTSTRTSASSLTSGGGQGTSTTTSQVGRTSTATENVPLKGALQILEELGANASPVAKASTFNGLRVTADSRTNTLTLVGSPELIQTATAYLTRLDTRRKQVAINVKIVEVDLTKSSNVGASFSFGVADNFFTVNQGQGTANIGPFNPALADNPNSLTSPVTIPNPFANVQPPLNTNAPIVNSQGNTLGFQPASPINPNPLAAVVTNLTGGAVSTSNTVTTVLNQAVTYGLPPLFQFPLQFLLRLQAQVTSGNAKILTDPTLIVQEGSQSQVNLTSQVFSGFTEQRLTEGNVTTTRILPQAPIDVGIILNIQVDKIDENDFVTLSLSPEVSSLGQQITDPSRNNLLIQQLVNRRRLETGVIRLRGGQTLILTGIIQEQDRTITTKVPILGDIPLLNLLFRNRRTQHQRNEVVVLVTPQILDDSGNLPYGYNYTPGPELRQLLRSKNPPARN